MSILKKAAVKLAILSLDMEKFPEAIAGMSDAELVVACREVREEAMLDPGTASSDTILMIVTMLTIIANRLEERSDQGGGK